MPDVRADRDPLASNQIGLDQDDITRYQWRRRRRSFGLTSLLLLLVLAASAVGGGLYVEGYDFKPVKRLLASTGLVHDFGPLYERYGMQPLPADLELSVGVFENLVHLETSPCDKRAIFAAQKALDDSHHTRESIALLLGFAKQCQNGEGEIRTAVDHLITLGDFEQAYLHGKRLVTLRPDVADYAYLLAKAEAGLGRTDDALQDYANTIKLTPNQSQIGQWVFFEMSRMYAAKKRYCEAITPIETYVSMNPAQRETSQTRKLIDDYSAQGNCNSYAQGGDKFTVLTNSVIPVRVLINGVPGTFALDTGASFVTITDAFAKKAGISDIRSGLVTTTTANGVSTARLASAATINVGHTSAVAVPIMVQEKSFGTIDGLLGRSYLSRFDLTISEGVWTLHPKPKHHL